MTTGVAEVQSRIVQIQALFLPPARTTTTRATASTDFGTVLESALDSASPVEATGVAGERVVAAARAYLGVPYVWGGTDPETGLDCSGFVQRAFRDVGVTLPRVSRDQARAGQAVESLADARPGDLVAFGEPVDHIGIYLGNGTMIVAPHRGGVVRIQRITRPPSAIRRVGAGDTAPSAAAPPRASTTARPQAATSFDGHFRAAGGTTPAATPHKKAVAKAESDFNPRCVSSAGAQGMMQLMPSNSRRLGVDPFDPAQAVDGAARMLAGHKREFGSWDLALAAYNAGGPRVRRHGGVPPIRETQNYVKKVLANWEGQQS